MIKKEITVYTDKLPHSVPKGPKSGRASLKTRKGLVQGKKSFAQLKFE
jgi:hypothetical protein